MFILRLKTSTTQWFYTFSSDMHPFVFCPDRARLGEKIPQRSGGEGTEKVLKSIFLASEIAIFAITLV